MITVNKKLEKGMKEAALSLNISEKTLRNWLKNGRIPAPPEVKQGTRVLRYFPDEYLSKAKILLDIQ